MQELSDASLEQLENLCDQGDQLCERGEYEAALENFWTAWDLLPAPQTDWNESTWILTAIGDINFLTRNYAAGRDNLSMALHCPNAAENPFLRLRLGQCLFELGLLHEAAEELQQAHTLGGTDVFDDAKKYLQFLTNGSSEPGKMAA